MVQRSSRDYVPTADAAGNVTMADVIGNKTDTGTSGDSVVSLVKKNNTDILVIDGYQDVPTQDAVTNLQMRDVIGNKTDTKNGSSIFAKHEGLLEKTTLPTQNLATNLTFAQVIGNKTDTEVGSSIYSKTVQIGQNHVVPTADSANNAMVRDVVGNKTDTKNGDSIYAKHEALIEKTTLATQDLADNNTFSQVIGNKTDTKNGTSLVAFQQQHLDRSGLPTQNSANNNVFADVIGNKTDTTAGTSIMSKLAFLIASSTSTSNGTFSYLDAGGEQDVAVVTPASGEIVQGIWLDLSNMAQNGTIKIYYKIDGSNYRQVSVSGTVQSYAFTVADGVDGVYIPGPFGFGPNQYKVTYEEGADEGAARAIPYVVVRERKVLT